MNSTNKTTVVSLFSGAGGMDLGFVNAGCEILWANDFFQDAVNTYRKNVNMNITYGDITKIKSEDIPDNPDIVIGGFPCQGFSIANNNRSMQDERNFLYKELLRIIRDKKPKFFVAENVKGLISMDNGAVLKLIISDFENIGYKVDYKLLNAAEYGIPQMRQRVIIIGNRIGAENPFPKITHYIDKPVVGLKKCPTVKDIIGELENVPLSNDKITLDDGSIITNHIAYTNVKDKFFGRKYEVDQIELCDYLREYRSKSGLSNKKIAELLGVKQTTVDHWFRKDNNSGSIPSKEDYLKLKMILNLDDTYEVALTTYIEKEIKFEQSLRISNWDRPSDTITATSPEIHINKQRRLSVRECARIQTFPDDFEFTGTIEKQYRQVGNAVPVKLAELIAQGILNEIKKSTH
jgi:DNA (cytosine-5)-methyltransferase 1